MPLPYNKNKIPLAKKLRKDMTYHEKKLWYLFLSKYPVRFQRQKTISSFIEDFYCAKALLGLELDGDPHFTSQGIAYDNERSMILKREGIDILRFKDDDVENRFDYVCECIDTIVKQKMENPSRRFQKASQQKSE